jgi:hypothetical protein
MNRDRDIPPADSDDEVLADHTMMVSRRSPVPADSLRPGSLTKPAQDAGPLDDPDDRAVLDSTRISRRSSMVSDVTTRRSGPPTDGTIVVARGSGPPTDGTVVVRQSGPSTDGTIVVARGSGPPTDGTVVVRQSGPSTDGTVVVRPGRPSSRTAMADPVLRGRARRTGLSKPPRTIHEERPRYTPRAMPPPPGPPPQILEGPTALRGTAPLPSVAAASRRSARVALAVWLVLSAVCAVGAVWCATALFG